MYVYLNPRTGEIAVCKDFSQEVEQALMPEKGDLLIGYSSYSNTVKIYHWTNNPTDGWYVESVCEALLKIMSLNELI